MKTKSYRNVIINEDFAVQNEERLSNLLTMGGINYLQSRDLKDFKSLLEDLDEDLSILLWIHPSFGKYVSTKQTTSGMMAISYLKQKGIDFEIITSVEESTEVEKYSSRYGKKAINVLELDEHAQKRTPINIREIKLILDLEIRNRNGFPKFDIGILTALFDWELENILNAFGRGLWNFNSIKVENRFYHTLDYTLLDSRKISIIAASQLTMGMIDAAILSSEIINLFRPDYLVMTGVCGAKPDDLNNEKADITSDESKLKSDINFGDLIIPNRLFTFQKGKFTKAGFEHETEVCPIDEKVLQLIEMHRQKLIEKVMDADKSRDYTKKRLNVHIEPMACSTAVINEPGKFNEIKEIDRKVVAVDMESYSIARACEITNQKKTKAIVIKGVMDKTQNKSDDSKPFAAFTSAQFFKHFVDCLYSTD
jgi:nucleoside phosphorylase